MFFLPVDWSGSDAFCRAMGSSSLLWLSEGALESPGSTHFRTANGSASAIDSAESRTCADVSQTLSEYKVA